MPRIPSPNPDFAQIAVPGAPNYRHPIDERAPNKSDIPIPMAFQVTSPFDPYRVLLPHALVLHVNPMSLQVSHNQKVERFQTRGGFVEQHWGQELSDISADQSTGAFMNIRTGLTSVLRQRTIAWDRYRDLMDLFRNNGSVHNPFGAIVLQGQILIMYDRGFHWGTFRTFEWEDTEESPFAFKLSWSFKVEQSVEAMTSASAAGFVSAPTFQGANLSADGVRSNVQNAAAIEAGNAATGGA